MWLVDLIVVRVRRPEQNRLRKWVGPVETRRSGPVAPYDSHAWVGYVASPWDVGVVSEWTAQFEFERARGLSRFIHTESIVGPRPKRFGHTH